MLRLNMFYVSFNIVLEFHTLATIESVTSERFPIKYFYSKKFFIITAKSLLLKQKSLIEMTPVKLRVVLLMTTLLK